MYVKLTTIDFPFLNHYCICEINDLYFDLKNEKVIFVEIKEPEQITFHT